MKLSHPAVPTDTVQLPGGGAMPLLGFGTWQLTGADAARATAAALAVGYRHVDTARMYGNESEVGTALRSSGVDRAEVFITTKLPADEAADPRRSLSESLRRLQTAYLDLWLIHWPTGHDGAVWDVFVAARDEGLVRDIGVSNFSLQQIDELIARGVAPAVNQIRWSPLLYDPDVVAGHEQRGVVLEGYSALRGGALDHPDIVSLAKRLGRTPAQVILRWHLQHGFVAIPKSADEKRIAANADLADFVLSADALADLDALGNP